MSANDTSLAIPASNGHSAETRRAYATTLAEAMLVPEAALPFIRLHRTNLEGDLPQAYARDVQQDFAEMRPWLPPQAAATLDIGCGMAGIDVCLWRHYRQPTLNLLDGTGETETRVSFQPAMSPYNSMPVARQLLCENGVDAAKIVEWPPQPDLTIPCDVALSLLSWGFHYPVSTYLSLVLRSLRPGGKLILDLRHGTGGVQEVAAVLRLEGVIRDTAKYHRYCFAAD